jgi:hypothetical protein
MITAVFRNVPARHTILDSAKNTGYWLKGDASIVRANGGQLHAVNVAYHFYMPATGGENCVTLAKPPVPASNGENSAARNRSDDLLDEKGRS